MYNMHGKDEHQIQDSGNLWKKEDDTVREVHGEVRFN